MLAVRGIERHVEVPHRWHHLDRLAGLEPLVDPCREGPARRLFHGDPKRAILDRGTDRVRPPKIVVGNVRAQREMLALDEAERLGKRWRHVERQRHRVARLARDMRDPERMELAHRVISAA